MKNIYLNIYKPNLINLKKAKKNIENNNVIGIPTETGYGLAANAYSDKAVKKIFKLKKRPSFNPLIIHFKNLNSLKNDVVLSESFLKLYKAFVLSSNQPFYLIQLLHYYLIFLLLLQCKVFFQSYLINCL